MKKISNIILLLIFGLASALGAEAKKDFLSAIEKTAEELGALWGEGNCENIVVRKKGFPFASIACRGSFDSALRRNFLDSLFRHGFKVQKESYKLKPRHGMYLYKTARAGRVAYFKLFVREAEELWPRNPVEGKVLAIYVQNVKAANDLVRWRTLGLTLTYGITFGRSDTPELIEQSLAYGEEVWLALPLDDGTAEVTDGQMLHISDALEADKLTDYLAGIESSVLVKGVSPLYCSHFCKNVPALRALFTALREKNEDAAPILLDTTTFAESSFSETGRIMNFRSLKASREKDFCAALADFEQSERQNIARIISVDAGDEKAFRCLSNRTQKQRQGSIDFVKVSEISQSNPDR